MFLQPEGLSCLVYSVWNMEDRIRASMAESSHVGGGVLSMAIQGKLSRRHDRRSNETETEQGQARRREHGPWTKKGRHCKSTRVTRWLNGGREHRVTKEVVGALGSH